MEKNRTLKWKLNTEGENSFCHTELLTETMAAIIYKLIKNAANCELMSQIEVIGSVFPDFRFLSQR